MRFATSSQRPSANSTKNCIPSVMSVDAQISWEDQKNICRFSDLNQTLMRVSPLVKETQRELEELEDAMQETELLDETEDMVR